MKEDNGYAVTGTLRMLQRGDITLEQAVDIVNIWIELTARKFYNEGALDGMKVNRGKKSHQALCDMVPENSADRSQKHSLSEVELSWLGREGREE